MSEELSNVLNLGVAAASNQRQQREQSRSANPGQSGVGRSVSFDEFSYANDGTQRQTKN